VSLRLVEFSERMAFGHYRKQVINPEAVAALTSVSEGEETLVTLVDGQKLLVSARIGEVRSKLLGEEAEK
jgi:uncharacterized protein YlzI (FlbEa/FlbD family)